MREHERLDSLHPPYKLRPSILAQRTRSRGGLEMVVDITRNNLKQGKEYAYRSISRGST